MLRNKYILNCLMAVDSKEELEEFWSEIGLDQNATEDDLHKAIDANKEFAFIDHWICKCRLLRDVMGGQYFDIPKDSASTYLIYRDMFLDFNTWKPYKKIELIKELVAEL